MSGFWYSPIALVEASIPGMLSWNLEDSFYPEIQVKNIGQNDEHNVDVNLKIEKIIDTIYNPPFWRQVQYSGYGLWDQSP